MFGPGKRSWENWGLNTAGFNRVAPRPRNKNNGELYGIGEGNAKPYDMLNLIDCMVDGDSFDES